MEPRCRSALRPAIKESFPYVRVFRYQEGYGYHVLASLKPIPNLQPRVLAARMPPRCRA